MRQYQYVGGGNFTMAQAVVTSFAPRGMYANNWFGRIYIHVEPNALSVPYLLRVDDQSDPWFTPGGGDLMADWVSENTDYAFRAGHAYTLWAHGVDKSGRISPPAWQVLSVSATYPNQDPSAIDWLGVAPYGDHAEIRWNLPYVPGATPPGYLLRVVDVTAGTPEQDIDIFDPSWWWGAIVRYSFQSGHTYAIWVHGADYIPGVGVTRITDPVILWVTWP
jgi:hypothetical protein